MERGESFSDVVSNQPFKEFHDHRHKCNRPVISQTVCGWLFWIRDYSDRFQACGDNGLWQGMVKNPCENPSCLAQVLSTFLSTLSDHVAFQSLAVLSTHLTLCSWSVSGLLLEGGGCDVYEDLWLNLGLSASQGVDIPRHLVVLFIAGDVFPATFSWVILSEVLLNCPFIGHLGLFLIRTCWLTWRQCLDLTGHKGFLIRRKKQNLCILSDTKRWYDHTGTAILNCTLTAYIAVTTIFSAPIS